VRTRAILAGIFAGLALTWRVDLAPGLMLAIGAHSILARWRWRDVLWLLLAAGIALIPLLIHAIIVTPRIFLDSVFYTPVIRTHHARNLPLDFSHAYVGQVYALTVIAILSALAVGWSKRHVEGGEGVVLFTAGLFALGILPQALQRADIAHLSDAACVAVPLFALTVSFLSRRRLTPLFLVGAVCLALPQTLQIIYILHTNVYGTYWVTNGEREIGASFPVEQQVIDFIRNHARPNESLFVGTSDLRFTNANDVDIYHLFPSLRPATYFIEFNPLSANRPDSRLASDLAKADWVILDSVWTREHEPNGSMIPGPNGPNEVLQKKFKLVFEARPFDVLRRVVD
jgi:hypothetical protein